MNFFETSYGVFFGSNNTVLSSSPPKPCANFCREAVTRGPLWGFSDHPPAGLPGPQWLASDAASVVKGSAGSSRGPLTTYGESYQIRSKSSGMVHHAHGAHAQTQEVEVEQEEKHIESGAPEQVDKNEYFPYSIKHGETAISTADKSIHESKRSIGRRQDTLSWLSNKGDHSMGTAAFMTSSQAIGRVPEGLNTINQLFASQKGERTQGLEGRRKDPAGIDSLKDSLWFYPPKLAAYSNFK
ncbi:uncharacterized protein LOC34618339 [Cyclospora cayetanensis]|uniref:Uncharacterized protein n=2 Tax=Cyclospora cayetanensis TaxID=88456 RepID=A0A1D3D9A9_9EIME|nr:uncharacterized protein LOC34618339 [Cyclospora cayetanensis]OEH80040.1 hypothetical protein cyc_01314 [Cyclospora cayetanensis]